MSENKKTSTVKKRFRIELSLAEASGWATLLLFICGWFFVLGVFVGRGLVPVPGGDETFREYLAALKEKSLTRPAVTAKEEPAAPAPETPAASPVPKTPPNPAAAQTQAALPAAADQPEKKPGNVKNTRTEAGKKPDSLEDKIFTIQVAALRDQQTADAFFENLKEKNYAPYIVKATLADDVTWYRLRCGAFANRDEAAPVLERLRKDGYSPILVRR